MTVKDLIKKKDYDYISWRFKSPDGYCSKSIFAGACKSVNGELIPLDGDSYNKNEIILEYEEWTKNGIKNGLTVVIDAEWITG